MAKDGVDTDLSDIFLILGLEPITIACLITFRDSLLPSNHCFKESKSLLRVSLRCYYGIRLQNFSIFQKSPFLSINYRKVWKWSLLFHCNDAKLNKWPFTYDGMFQLALATT